MNASGRFNKTFHMIVGFAFVVALFAATDVLAQGHGIGVVKECPTATKIGDLATCTLTFKNQDGSGDGKTFSRTCFIDGVWGRAIYQIIAASFRCLH